MEYKPRLPKHNSNISHQSPLKDFATLLAGIIAIFAVVYFSLGLIIDQTVKFISPQTEAELFSSFTPKSLSLFDDKKAISNQQQWRQVLDKIESCANVGYSIDLTVVESPQINAMAFPGGKVIVLSGLDDVLASENAMAFILAHELAHFSNRDHLRMMGRSVVLMALLGLAGQSSDDIIPILAPVSEFETAQFSQFNESEADKTALQTLNCAYGHVGGSTEFFEKLKAQPDQFNFAMMHYFATHPELNLRIEQINQLVEQLGYENNEVIKRPLPAYNKQASNEKAE